MRAAARPPRRARRAPRRAEGRLRGAQRRYRDILRHSLLYTWDNERGQPWCAPGRARPRARRARRPAAHAGRRAGGT